jgi:hypothetical protein
MAGADFGDVFVERALADAVMSDDRRSTPRP